MASAGVLYGLVQPRVVESHGQVHRPRDPASRCGDGARSARSRPARAAPARARRRSRSTSAARSSRHRTGGVDRQPASAGGGVDRHQAAAVHRRRQARRAPDLHHHPGRGLVVGEGVDVDASSATASGCVPGLRLDDDRVLEVRGGLGRPPRTSRRTRRRTGVRSAARSGRTSPRPRKRWSHRCRARPRSRRASEKLGQAVATCPTTRLHRRLAVAGPEIRRQPTRPARRPASGRTFEGPEPNRPSPGSRWAGITMSGVSVTYGIMAS